MKKTFMLCLAALMALTGCVRKQPLKMYEGEPMSVDTFSARIMAIDYEEVSGNLALGFNDSVAVIWSPAGHEAIAHITCHRYAINDVVFSPDGNILLTASADESFTIVDAVSGEVLDAVAGLNGPVTTVDFSSDGALLAVGFADNLVEIWNVDPLEKYGNFTDPIGVITSVRFRPGSYDLYISDRDSLFYIANAQDTVSSFKAKENYGYIFDIAVSADGRFFATGGTNNLVKVWKSDTITSVGWYERDLGKINTIAFHPGSEILVAGDQQGQLVVLEIVEPADSTEQKAIESGLKLGVVELGRLNAHQGALRACVFSSDGNTLYTGGDDQLLKVWDFPDIISTLRSAETE